MHVVKTQGMSSHVSCKTREDPRRDVKNIPSLRRRSAEFFCSVKGRKKQVATASSISHRLLYLITCCSLRALL